MRRVLAILLSCVAGVSGAQVPAPARAVLPLLKQEIAATWPAAPAANVAAQIHRETCITPTHRYCWNPHAELKTRREYGFGLGQHTIAYTADGRVRFDKWAELRSRFPALLDEWTWERRYDARMQLRAVLLQDSALARDCSAVTDDSLECLFCSYNGGFGGFLQDQRLCAATPGCDPMRWWGNVERTSLKAKTSVAGYGASFFEINRSYVRFIMRSGAEMYRAAMETDG